DNANWVAANRTLMNPIVETAVFENSFDAILNEGLAYDRCQVGVITNIDANCHIGRNDIETVQQVFTVLRTQIDVVTSTAAVLDDVKKNISLPTGAAILNAKDEMAIEIAEICDGEVIFFSSEAKSPVIAHHCTNGTGPTHNKRAVILRKNTIILTTGTHELPLIKVSEISSQSSSKPNTHEIENILAAIAATWALGLEINLIRRGIETFGLNQQKFKPENQDLSINVHPQGIYL
ncbi:MAG TPA: cyanophycin synthetase, partial [Nitrosomonas sp.]|nr:cyanophycin synthetase [Nitrosomonas sp.]